MLMVSMIAQEVNTWEIQGLVTGWTLKNKMLIAKVEGWLEPGF